jgi:hypothetical protein
MKQAFLLYVVVASGLFWADKVLGYQAAYEIGYGALSIMALMISMTFMWLWQVRATPLALGMAFGWLGAASVMGWWWIFNIFDQPAAMVDNGVLFLFLSAYFVGAGLHFSAVQRSFGLRPWLFGFPIVGSTAISVLIHAIS